MSPSSMPSSLTLSIGTLSPHQACTDKRQSPEQTRAGHTHGCHLIKLRDLQRSRSACSLELRCARPSLSSVRSPRHCATTAIVCVRLCLCLVRLCLVIHTSDSLTRGRLAEPPGRQARQLARATGTPRRRLAAGRVATRCGETAGPGPTRRSEWELATTVRAAISSAVPS